MKKTFRTLVDTERRRGVADDEPPRTMAEIAEQLGMTRSHLYNLMNGNRAAPDWTVARIAKAFGLNTGVVRRALDRSRAAALL